MFYLSFQKTFCSGVGGNPKHPSLQVLAVLERCVNIKGSQPLSCSWLWGFLCRNWSQQLSLYKLMQEICLSYPASQLEIFQSFADPFQPPCISWRQQIRDSVAEAGQCGDKKPRVILWRYSILQSIWDLQGAGIPVAPLVHNRVESKHTTLSFYPSFLNSMMPMTPT